MSRAALLAAVVIALVAAWASGLYAHLSPERVGDVVARAGILGPVAFVALFAAAETVHLPGSLFIVAAALLWPPAIAIPTAYVGALASALAIFWLARHIVPDGVRERIPERLLRHERRLETHGLSTVIALRLVLFLSPAVHWLLGASRVSFRNFALGTAIGLLPGVVVVALLGRHALEHWELVRALALGAVALVLAGELARRMRARRVRVSRP